MRVFFLAMCIVFFLGSCSYSKSHDFRIKELEAKIEFLVDQGDYKKAAASMEENLEFVKKHYEKESSEMAGYLNNLAFIYKKQKLFVKAEKYYKESIALVDKAHGKNNPENAITFHNLAALYHDQAKYNEAEKYYKLSLKLLEKNKTIDPLDHITFLENIGDLYKDQNQLSKAIPYYERSLSIAKANYGNSELDFEAAAADLLKMKNKLNKNKKTEELKK